MPLFEKIVEQAGKNLNKKEKAAKIQPEYSLQEQSIYNRLNSMFYEDREELIDKRLGLHASSLVQTKKISCFREKVLSLIHKPEEKNNIPAFLARRYKQGSVIHKKWQDLFCKSFKGCVCERRFYSKKYNLYFTPDIICDIFNTTYVIEIKSMATKQYQEFKTPSVAKRQLMLYMFLLGIEKGILLLEDKNTQDFRVIEIEYSKEEILPTLLNLKEILHMKKDYDEENELPGRFCSSSTVTRAKNCWMKEYCFKEEF